MVKVKFEKEGQLGIITFMDKPLNLIDSVFLEELEAILSNLESRHIRALLFKVDVGNFSAGANVGLFQNMEQEAIHEMLQRFLRLVNQIEIFPYPTMAAVKGMCIGGGFEIALSCDYIWASENAQFAAAEVLIGIVPLGGGAQRLAQRCGIARAKEITLGGRFVKPELLEKWSVINRVLPEKELNEKAIKFMNFQSNGPTIALDTIKKLLREYYKNGLEDSENLLLSIVPKLFKTEDIKIGIESFKKQGPGKAIFNGK
jgi:enoyl-CoA hydratase/carnithine racemase